GFLDVVNKQDSSILRYICKRLAGFGFYVDIPSAIRKMLENFAHRMEISTKRKDVMDQWLRCQVYPGQFSVEYAVVVRQSDEKEVSLFAPQEFVDCEQMPTFDRPVHGWIKVVLVKKQGELALVELPRSTLENGQYITVRADQLKIRSPRQPA